MSEPHKTTGRPLASTLEEQQQPEQSITEGTTSSRDKRRKGRSTSSNDTFATIKSISPRLTSSCAAQRSTLGPSSMSTVNYTKTGRVSKAKKGLKVHDCECGRSYTRAEHLRRHQRNHAQEGAMICKYPDCGKAFFRSDLLQRHEERHDDIGNVSRRPSVSSTEHSARASPGTASATLPVVTCITPPPAVANPQQHVVSPLPEVTSFPRYNPSLFRAPQIPRTPKIAPSNFSNHVFHSSQHFKTPMNDIKHQHLAFSARHSISGPVLTEAAATCGAWHDSFVQSPYSCSSGYASPAPGPEYTQVYATPPFRTRASSNASYIEQTWAHASQSPTSSASVPYSWPSDEKSVVSSSFPFVPVTYPASSIPGMDMMSDYTQYDSRNIVQMDNEEGIQLFPGEHYGMSQIAHAYPFNQWLNNYWRLFHPTFPVVHRFTLSCGEISPMLYASMIAIDLHFSNHAHQRRRAMELHKICTRLLLQGRENNWVAPAAIDSVMTKLYFWLKLFHSIVRSVAQRRYPFAFVVFMRRYDLMPSLLGHELLTYRKLDGIRAVHSSTIFGLQLLDPAPREHIRDRWIHWSQLTAKQNLLLSCYVLESQQQMLLARHRPSTVEVVVDTLPFPVHDSLWNAASASEWTVVSQQHLNMPKTIYEALQMQTEQRFSIFQSAVLITTWYDQSNGPVPTLIAEFEHVLSQSATTRIQLLTAKLTHLVPMRALLAVSGETWIFGTKLTSEEECSSLKSALRAWTDGIWASTTEHDTNSTAEALRIAIAILNHSLETGNPLALGLGIELSLFFAALVLWAATAAASSRVAVSSDPSQHLEAAFMLDHEVATMCHTATRSKSVKLVDHPVDIQRTAFSGSLEQKLSIPWVEIFSQTSLFLSTAMTNISTSELATCHTGCASLLLWTKMHLRGAFSNDSDSAEIDASSSEHHRGEIINEAISQIERMLDHDWEGWGI
ncbi:hypothetical protein SVAN01_03008 [Stagonosporopsis vannaccii]|nr:hypothetical protein SVAN01_03008 [Stagonosporopsis vannaccii]